MQPMYILLVSAAVTGGIVYGIYYITSSKKSRAPQKTILKDLDLEVEEEFLDEIQGGFEGRIYKKSLSSENSAGEAVVIDKKYPDCFGTSARYKTCAKDCGVNEECASTVTVLEGF